MSFSFTVRASDKAEALDKVAAEMARVVETQPTHALDSYAVQIAAENSVRLLRDDDTKDISVSMSGSLTWIGVSGSEGWSAEKSITGSAISVHVYQVGKA